MKSPARWETGFWAIARRSVLQLVRRPLYWGGILFLPLFMLFFFTSLMKEGLPANVPAAMIDRDGSALSRQITQELGSMQMVNLVAEGNSYNEGKRLMQEGKIYGFFMIPENYQKELLAGRKPVITFYTNTSFFVPAQMLFRTFKSVALFTKAGVATEVISDLGVTGTDPSAMLMPVSISVRGIGNPWLNYSYYLSSSFVPAALQLMILLITCFSIGQEVKYHTSVKLLRMAKGNIYKAIAAKLLPQTVAWVILALFIEAWLYKYCHFPMHGSWFWLTVSEIMFVLASQGLGIFFYGLLPSLRMSLSISALLGILAFSIAAFSFPVQSMYPAIGMLSWIYPVRYNFLIESNIALNGLPVYYSRVWFACYIIFMLLPFTLLWRIRRDFAKPVYAP